MGHIIPSISIYEDTFHGAKGCLFNLSLAHWYFHKLIRASVQHFIVLIIQEQHYHTIKNNFTSTSQGSCLIILVQGLLLSDEEQALKDYAHQIVISIGQAQSAIAWFNLWQGYFYILRSSS